MTATAREIVEQAVEAYNAKSLERVVSLYHPDARFWDPFHRDGVRGRRQIGELVEALFERFPDEQMTVLTLVSDDTHAVVEIESRGTARSGQPFRLTFTEVYEVYDEQIVSCHVYIDTAEVPD